MHFLKPSSAVFVDQPDPAKSTQTRCLHSQTRCLLLAHGDEMSGSSDPWIAPDKLYHVLFCLCLSLLFSSAASRTRYPFLRRHSVLLGSVASLLAGAAKEAADQLGIFPSAGASAKDALADLVGVIIAASALSCCRPVKRSESDTAHARFVSMV